MPWVCLDLWELELSVVGVHLSDLCTALCLKIFLLLLSQTSGVQVVCLQSCCWVSQSSSGDSGVDQLVEIIKVLGTPTNEQC